MRALLPSVITTVTLSCGLAALESVRNNAWDLTLRLILLAAVADGLDGALARYLGATSRMGEQLDSLADIIAFGAAPAFLYSTYFPTSPLAIRFGLPLVFVLGGAFRLARYHAQPSDGVFRGLPITAAGGLLALAVAGPFDLDAGVVAFSALALTGLMVSNHPFPKVERSRRSLLVLLAGAAVALLAWQWLGALALLGVLAFGAYLAWGLAGRAVAALLGKLHHDAPYAGLREAHEPGRPGP
jgi:CDP-diacylglycerol--serine O-phosphatidyltransferase